MAYGRGFGGRSSFGGGGRRGGYGGRSEGGGYGGGRSSGGFSRGGDSFEKPVKEGEEYDVQITEVGSKGDGITRIKNFVVFVPGTSKGENVRVKITQVKAKSAVAEVVGAAQGPAAAESAPAEAAEAPAEEAAEAETTEETKETEEDENGPDEE